MPQKALVFSFNTYHFFCSIEKRTQFTKTQSNMTVMFYKEDFNLEEKEFYPRF